MHKPLISLLAGILLAGCRADPPAITAPAVPTDAVSPSPATRAVVPNTPLLGWWQLDYYPDSLLLNRDVYDNSGWSSAAAANLHFVADSGLQTGWHEQWWSKVRPKGPKLYASGDASQGFLYKLVDSNKLLFRETGLHADSFPTWYPYHRVAAETTPLKVEKQLVSRAFAGRYRVLQSRRPADSVVTLGADQRVRGIPGVARYHVIIDMDWDSLLPNGFVWQTSKGKEVAQYSFRFSGDTLVLRNFEIHPEEESVPTGILLTTPTMKLLRLRRGN
jgi:hypothetical protein